MEKSKALPIPKTIKLFINGEFPRTESGRSFQVMHHGTKKTFANLCQASRKDLRTAVTAAQEALPAWEKRTSYNRSQILYRMAEMLEAKRVEVASLLAQTCGLTKKMQNQAVDLAIESLVYFCGFCDKYQQVIGSVNPVSGPHHCFTTAEPVGVVGLIATEDVDFAGFWASLAAILASGNTVIALLPTNLAALTGLLGEVLATADLPKGTVNLLSGFREELLSHFASHMEIHSLSYQGYDNAEMTQIRKLAAANMKRTVGPVRDILSLEHLIQYLEFKTVWHPIGN